MHTTAITPSIGVTIGRQMRLFHAFVTTAPAMLDAPSTVTLYLATLSDVSGLAAEPTALHGMRANTPARLVLVDSTELDWQMPRVNGLDAGYLRKLVSALSHGEAVPAVLRNECHLLMMAIDGNKLGLVEECVTRIHQVAQQEQHFKLPAPLHGVRLLQGWAAVLRKGAGEAVRTRRADQYRTAGADLVAHVDQAGRDCRSPRGRPRTRSRRSREEIPRRSADADGIGILGM